MWENMCIIIKYKISDILKVFVSNIKKTDVQFYSYPHVIHIMWILLCKLNYPQ